jgi:hypothetical protein
MLLFKRYLTKSVVCGDAQLLRCMIDHAMQGVCRCACVPPFFLAKNKKNKAKRNPYVDGVPVGSHLATAAAEL